MSRSQRRKFDRYARRKIRKQHSEQRSGPSPIVDKNEWWRTLGSKRRKRLEEVLDSQTNPC